MKIEMKRFLVELAQLLERHNATLEAMEDGDIRAHIHKQGEPHQFSDGFYTSEDINALLDRY